MKVERDELRFFRRFRMASWINSDFPAVPVRPENGKCDTFPPLMCSFFEIVDSEFDGFDVLQYIRGRFSIHDGSHSSFSRVRHGGTTKLWVLEGDAPGIVVTYQKLRWRETSKKIL